MLSKNSINQEESINKIVSNIPSLVTPTQNESLLQLISMEEVEYATRDILIGESPIVYGFTTYFYHHCWKVIQE